MLKRVVWAALVSVGLVGIARADMFMGNGDTSFGGALGNGVLTLDRQAGSTMIQARFTPGGPLNDTAVFYLDTTSGGYANTLPLEDLMESGPSGLTRQAVSGWNGQDEANVTFAAGFAADYAIAASDDYAALYQLDNPNKFTQVRLLNTALSSNTSVLDFELSDIGLVAGDSFNFVATYLNRGSMKRSAEAIGSVTGPFFSGDNSEITFTSFETYSSVIAPVPEPSSMAMAAIGTGLIAWRRRRKSPRTDVASAMA